jgi:hypothetical protein
VDEWTLEVAVRAGSLSERHARIEFDAYLQAWEVVHPDVWIDRLAPRPGHP